MFAPIKARVASSCWRNGINAVATEGDYLRLETRFKGRAELVLISDRQLSVQAEAAWRAAFDRFFDLFCRVGIALFAQDSGQRAPPLTALAARAQDGGCFATPSSVPVSRNRLLLTVLPTVTVPLLRSKRVTDGRG